ncbi:cytochrome P450 [Roridomyces roridus]|uniref:Cytochrome P450 n=1 Tax=Roridomyces roridus TaxID=1738132 RepID=A0AAD7BPS0_9AGAR|nr:cytochrome P450 [Roridomyces roridus]
MILRILLPILGTFACYALFHAAQFLYRELTSPLRFIVGPPSPSLLLGNFKKVSDDFDLMSRWRKQFGRTFRFRGLFSISELHTSDLKALNHVVGDNTIYRRAPAQRDQQKRMLGTGILYMETDQHKRQRRIMNQAFGVPQVKLLTEVFLEKAVQLRDIWAARVEGDGSMVDVFDGLRRVTLDVIGQAGFDYNFNALDDKPNELNNVFTELMHSPHAQSYAAVRLAQSIVPILKLFPLPGSRIVARARVVMDAIGGHIVSGSKAALEEERASTGKGVSLTGRRDLLSVLLKSNLSKDLPDNQRMSDEEVVAQIPTFFLAGHETTSASVAWALYALSLHPKVQSKLRDELFTLPTDSPSMDELNSLPYFEAFVRETMRLHAPAVFTTRMAMQDDVLPLAKPYVDQQGNEHHSLPIRKGQIIHIPIWAVNTDKEIWGEDALEFKPERWNNLPEGVKGIPGVWANLLSFYGGPHNCIGYRFSLAEMKALLFTFLRAFEFAPALPEGDIVPKIAGLIQRPNVLVGTKHFKRGSGLPLVVKAYKRD